MLDVTRHYLFFSVIDFNVMPVCCCASIALQNYVASHIGSEDSKNREGLMSMATKTHDLNKKNLELENIPMQIDAWSFQGALCPLNECSWQHDSYFMVMKQSVGTMTDLLISTTCLSGNENNKHRASQLINSGAMRIEHLQHKRCKSRIDENLGNLKFKIDFTPSMKSKVRNESVN